MKVLLKYLDRIPKILIPVIGLILVILIGIIDYLTGNEIAFTLLYLLPISFVAWFDKRNIAVMMSILSAAAWIWADIAAGSIYSHPFIPVWNTFIVLAFFLITVFSLAEIKKLLENEQKSARTDFLTGAANNRAFYESARMEMERAARFNHPLTLAYIDIDNFKQVNDSLGHTQGDSLLQSVVQTIKNNIRSIDLVARLGGDEFAVLFPETGETNAKTAIEKVQEVLIGVVRKHNWPVTFSIGAVTCYKLCDIDELIKQADTLIYSVKESGKNRIEYKIY